METFSASLAICVGSSPVIGEFPAQRPVTRSFDVFFDLHLNKRLSKQSWGWWFETPSRPLWRHCNDAIGNRKLSTEPSPQIGTVYTIYHDRTHRMKNNEDMVTSHSRTCTISFYRHNSKAWTLVSTFGIIRSGRNFIDRTGKLLDDIYELIFTFLLNSYIIISPIVTTYLILQWIMPWYWWVSGRL